MSSIRSATFQNAIVAKYMGIPYFVTGAPDQGHETVDSIHIEMRDPNFTLQAMGVRTAMEGVKATIPPSISRRRISSRAS